MGVRPVLAVPRLLQRFGLRTDDVNLWKLNKAFAIQVLHCRNRSGLPDKALNINGGVISLGPSRGTSRSTWWDMPSLMDRGRARGGW